MPARFDLVVRGGTVLDGTGGPAISGDVAVLDGRIAAIGAFDGAGREEIDARDRLVTPGFIDVHTHYDGQITWEESFAPSSTHGVTTVVMGNCGVGFAPCRPADRDMLIKVMEGVEDIPEVVMAEGIPWNWETFPQYLDALDRRHADIDFATQVPHAPVRVYVMGERGARREPATAQDMAAMAAIVREGVEAGALGFTTSRTLFHRLVSGELIPTSTAAEDELRAIARAMGAAGKGVIQLIDDFADCDEHGASEFAMLRRVVEASGRPLSFTVLDITSLGSRWRTLLAEIARANRDGLPMRGQVAGRPASVLYGLDLSYHPFSTCPSYAAVAALPLAEKLAALRDPALRARLLVEEPVYANPRLLSFMRDAGAMFELGDPPDYTPPRERRIDARAAALDVTPLELAYDLLTQGDGRTILYQPAANFTDCSDAAMAEMLRHPDTIVALGDGGAHYGMICDASYPTHALTYWTRDRPGEKFSLPWIVRRLTRDSAVAVGLEDRGALRVGLKGDLNVVDYDRLACAAPTPVRDLPGGARRLRQPARGYDATVVSGVVTYRDGVFQNARPGRLVRGARTA